MKIAKRCVISGRVQGVFYRQGTYDRAKQLGLTGWVKNLPTGEVECLLCGESDAVDTLCEWLWEGPRAAQVTDVSIKEVPWEDHEYFLIIR